MGVNDLSEVLKKLDKTVGRESHQNRRVSMSLDFFLKFAGNTGLSGSFPVYIWWIILKFRGKDRK